MIPGIAALACHAHSYWTFMGSLLSVPRMRGGGNKRGGWRVDMSFAIIISITSRQQIARARRSHRVTYHINPIIVARTATRIGALPQATHACLIPSHHVRSAAAVRMVTGGDAVHIGLRPLGGERCRCRGSRAQSSCARVIMSIASDHLAVGGSRGTRVPRQRIPES